MKKGIFTIIVILLIISPLVPVRADDSAPTGGSLVPSDFNDFVSYQWKNQGDEEKYGEVSFILELLRQGASIDCSNAEDSYGFDDLWDDVHKSVADFLHDYTGENNFTWINPFSISDFITEYGYKLEKGQVRDTVKNWRQYIKTQPTELLAEPTPTPPVDYTDKVNTILSDYVGIYGTGYVHFFDYDLFWRNSSEPLSQLAPVSLFCSGFNFNSMNSYYDWIFFSYGIADVNYNTSTGNMTVSNFNTADPYTYIYQGQTRNASGYIRMSLGSYGWYNSTNNNLPEYFFITDHRWQTHFNSVNDFIDYCYMYFRHVNIYVDGEPWGMVGTETHSISIGGGIFYEENNQPIEYNYPVDVYVDLDDIIDRLDTLIRQKQKIEFPDFSDLIVDVNGQQAFAVYVVPDDETLDDNYIKNYGIYVPIFPISATFPVSLSDLTVIGTTGTECIPDDLMGVLGVLGIGTLFVCLLQRLLE